MLEYIKKHEEPRILGGSSCFFLLKLCGAQGRVQACPTEKLRYINILIRFLAFELCRAQGQQEKKKQIPKYAGNSPHRTARGRSVSNEE